MFQIILLTLKQLNQLMFPLFFNLSFSLELKVWNMVKISSHSCGVSKFQQFLYIHFTKMKLHKVLAAAKRLRVCLRIGQQDYTVQLAACSIQRFQDAV